MTSEFILKSDVLDIIFEKRNKAYGAYTLRKFYASRLIKSLGLMLVVVIILSAFTFLPVENKTVISIVDVTLSPTTGSKEKKLEAPKQPVKKGHAASKKMAGTPVIIENSKSDSISTFDPSEKTGTVEIIATGVNGFGTDAPGGNEISEPGEGIKSAVVMDVTKVISNPDVMPEYPGGLSALRKFLERNLRNPRDLEEGERISVKVKFVVGYDGKLKSFETEEDGGSEFNNEVIRVLKKMPGWIPGISKGQNVSVYYSIPVKFINEE